MAIHVRDARLEDAARLVEIYSYYVENTVISFEYTTPTIDEFQMRMQKTMEKFPYLVVERDGRVEGYAYASPYIGRRASDRSVETTIYLDRNAGKGGLGRLLYEALESRLKEQGILNLYAAIAYPDTPDEYLTTNSADFHAHLGYTECGRFHKCGYKFGRWYDLLWMEKFLGPHKNG